MARYNKLCDGVANLASNAFTSTYVRDDPRIYTCRAMRGGKDNLKWFPSKVKIELTRDLLI